MGWGVSENKDELVDFRNMNRLCSAKLTEFRPLAAVQIEGQVALLLVHRVVVKDHSVGAQLLRDRTVTEGERGYYSRPI